MLHSYSKDKSQKKRDERCCAFCEAEKSILPDGFIDAINNGKTHCFLQ